jgi:LPXTG-site transpeptidase (sortase) family protein
MRTNNTTPASFSAAASAIAAIAVLITLLVSDRPAPAAPLTVERIQAAAPEKAAPRSNVRAAARSASSGIPSDECPQMKNPGGRLQWGTTGQQGPSATGGHISLPTLDVLAPIVKVGIDGANKMVVPHNARDVAWLDRGGIHGYTNNVVLAGHISYSRVSGSFMRIGALRPGDEVRMDMNGDHYKYRVTFVCLFGRDTDRAAQIMGYTEKPSLTLISCGGGWDSGARTHTGRYAVRAELVDGPGSRSGDRTEAAAADPSPTRSPGSLLDLDP